VRITAQLIDATSGTHLWADRFDVSLEDVFDLQDKVASSVAGIIEPTLQAAETASSAYHPTNDLTAYDPTCALMIPPGVLGEGWLGNGAPRDILLTGAIGRRTRISGSGG
jgi:hypothetical protein